jgi:site-specific recombinase XerD
LGGASNGANILKVKEMAGHAAQATTQRYLHDLEALENNGVECNPLAHA